MVRNLSRQRLGIVAVSSYLATLQTPEPVRKLLAVIAYPFVTIGIALFSLLLTVILSPVYAWATCKAIANGKPKEQRGQGEA